MRSNENLAEIIAVHAEEACLLHARRDHLVGAPQASLFVLEGLDARIAAHLDGLEVGGAEAWAACEAALDPPSADAVFVFATRALLDRDEPRLQRAIRMTEETAEVEHGLISSFGWVDSAQLRGVVADLLRGLTGPRRALGIAACTRQRVDAGIARLIQDEDESVRTTSLRAAGELGRIEMVSTCANAMTSEQPAIRFWAACSAVLLGERDRALAWLSTAALEVQSRQALARQLALQASAVTDGHELLRQIADSKDLRNLLKGAGHVGDPQYVPWIIGQMSDDALARLAGEAFALITGLDLTQPPFFREKPPDMESGPTEDPEDENVEIDEDDGLPWPDQAKIQTWWDRNGARFTTGVRHFMGAPPNRTHCIEVLKNGYQRQRIAAAYHLCLLNPGTPLFEWRAPAWRQQRELAQMT